MNNIDNIQCSVCEQYAIDKVKIKKNNDVIYICEECDRFWINKEDISDFNKAEVFEEYMIERGLSPYWDELEIIEEYI
ncbi:hypothetical protein [Clostridium botulinum]|uniref:hypothetical protein n=1 Tax=Clostridium botulinum TaxID=1491 RepID=UPI0004D7D559|nr:hypothetical protein [Clostridium botulinum]KEH93784.1 hypothetical protein Z963_01090 [Clostridium botulinum C/D str. It1]